MSDSIALEVNGQRIESFESYTVDSDLYVADHAFSLEVRNPKVIITPGMPCKLYVNNKLELTGIIDRTVKRTDRQGWRMTIEGRDLMGLLVDSYCEDFVTVQGMKLSDLAQLLLKRVPFINRKEILFQQDLVGKLKTRRSREASYGLQALFGAGETERIAQIRPGMTVFQVLSMYALSRGQMFFSLPDGTFVFGRPMVGGDPEFRVIFNRNGSGNNATSAEVVEDYSKRYSKVMVISQRQATLDDGLDVSASFVGGASGTVTDDSFPFYKPFVQLSHNDSQTPKQHARLLLEKMRHDGLQLSYEMPRHSQNGVNLGLNRLCQVQDDINLVGGKPINGVYLISGRTLRGDKQNGPMTTLRLSPPGLVEDGGKAGGGRG
jgi:prophage tail gpP-like protein